MLGHHIQFIRTDSFLPTNIFLYILIPPIQSSKCGFDTLLIILYIRTSNTTTYHAVERQTNDRVHDMTDIFHNILHHLSLAPVTVFKTNTTISKSERIGPSASRESAQRRTQTETSETSRLILEAGSWPSSTAAYLCSESNGCGWKKKPTWT